MKKEIWKDITGYEGYYKASSLGRIKSIKRRVSHGLNRTILLKEKLRVQTLNKKRGYKYVMLSKGGVNTNFSVHALIAIAFLGHTPNKSNKICVDHINNDKLDNRLVNLQLISNRLNSSKDQKGNTSIYIGVCWHKSHNKWVSAINVNGKNEHLGYYNDEKLASIAYNNRLKQIV